MVSKYMSQDRIILCVLVFFMFNHYALSSMCFMKYLYYSYLHAYKQISKHSWLYILIYMIKLLKHLFLNIYKYKCMYQHNWAALVNTDAVFFVLLRRWEKRKVNWYSKSDITTQYLCKENISKNMLWRAFFTK